MMGDVADAKAHDYADPEDLFSNFTNVGRALGLSPDRVFHLHIAVKYERMRQLMTKGEAKNESLEDTILDMANYAALWLAYRKTLRPTITTSSEEAILLDRPMGPPL